jgi:probable rRNA maturation factor
MPRSRRGITVAVTDDLGRPVAGAGLARWLERAAPARARGTVTIALVPDRTMRRLNQRHRRIDVATDVLSFPAGRDGQAAAPSLGEMAIATGVARRQARRQGHSLAVELRVLALHGMLHLLGYDHETDRGAMRRAEERYRRRAGLPAGLMARAPGRMTRR